MKKILTMAAGAALLAGAAMGVANAQGKAAGPFADVPTDHWAYTSVEKLRDAGIVIGYPDGTYGGRRAMTRYEFATAIARLLDLINSKPGPVVVQPPVTNPPATVDLSPYAKQSDLDALRAEVTRRLTENEGAIGALRDLVNGFRPELQRLGADVAAANARLTALEGRVSAIEEALRRYTITGEVNIIGRSNINLRSGNQNLPVDKDGNRFGTLGNDSFFNTPQVYHDVLLNITGKVANNAQAVIRIDAGNYLPWLGSATEQARIGFGGSNINGAPANTAFNIYEAYLAVPVSLGPLGGAEAVIGRQGIQFTPYTLKAVDPDSYAYSPETDSGNVIIDGGKLGFGLGPTRISAFVGKAGPIQNFSISGNPQNFARNRQFRPGSLGFGSQQFPQNVIDNIAGGRVTFGNADKWSAGVTAVLARTQGGMGGGNLGLNLGNLGLGNLGLGNLGLAPVTDPNTGRLINSMAVYGADFNGILPFFGNNNLTLNAEWAIDQTGSGSRFGNVNSQNGNEAWNAMLGYAIGGLSLKGGYQEVYGNFAAPGYWGKIGNWTNPTNIKGPVLSASYAFTPHLTLVADGNWYQGQYNLGVQNPLGKDDKLTRYNIGLKYGLTSAYSVDLGYEWVEWDLRNNQRLLQAAGKPTEQYITLGVGHNINSNTAVKLLYQMIEYKDKGTGFDNPNREDTRGGVAIGQVSFKF